MGRYRFTHALIRETLYEELSALRRTRLHRQAGEALEQLYARGIEAHLAELAYHFGQAAAGGTAEKAIDYAERAGEAARTAFAYEDAVRYWQSAADLLEELDEEPARRAALLQRIGITLAAITYGAERQTALDALEQAVALYERLGDERSAAEAHLSAGTAYSIFGPTWSVERFLAHNRAAEALFARLGDRAKIEQAQTAMRGVVFAQMRTAEGLELTSRRLALLADTVDGSTHDRPPWMHGWFLYCAGHVGDGLAEIEQGWVEADREGDSLIAANAAVWHANACYWWLSDLPEAARLIEREFALPRHGQRGIRAMLGHVLAACRLWRGDLSGGRMLLDALPSDEGLGPSVSAIWASCAGAWDAAATGMLMQEANAGGANRVVMQISLFGAAGYRAVEGRPDEAITLFRQGLEIAAGNMVSAECAYRAELARVLVSQGVFGEAHEHLERARALLAPDEDWHGLPGRVLHAEGVLFAAEGRLPEAKVAFAEAAALFRKYEAPWEEAEVELTRAGALQAAGETARADEHFAAAEAIYRRIGAGRPWLDRVQRMQAG